MSPQTKEVCRRTIRCPEHEHTFWQSLSAAAVFPQPNMIIIYCCIWVRWGNMDSIWFLLNNVISFLHKYKSNQRNQHWSQYQTLAYNTQHTHTHTHNTHTIHTHTHTHTHTVSNPKRVFYCNVLIFLLYLNIYYYISVAGHVVTCFQTGQSIRNVLISLLYPATGACCHKTLT